MILIISNPTSSQSQDVVAFTVPINI